MSDLRVPDLNLVTIAGRLTRDPELKYTSGNRAYARFGIANTRYYKKADGTKAEDTTFASCSVWDKQAEWLAQSVKKGRPVLIEGSLSSYEVEEVGQALRKNVSRLEIRVRRVTPLDWDEQTQTAQTSSTGQQGASYVQPKEDPIPSDDLPF